jgi:hypothetical protein
MPEDGTYVTLHTPEHEYNFKLTGGPLDDTASALDLFQALGHASSAWARLEQHVDIALMQINQADFSFGEKDLYDPIHPRTFSAKLDLLKDYFNKHPALAEDRGAIRELSGMIKEMSKERNQYLHSIVEAYDSSTQKVTFHSIQPQGKPAEGEHQVFLVKKSEALLKQITTFGDVTLKANRYFLEISRKLFTTEALKQLAGKQA